MKTEAWLKQATEQLKAAGIGTARLDALVLLEDMLNNNRAHLLSHPEQLLTTEQITKLEYRIARRKAHEPLSYIRGRSEFYRREFLVNRHVLEPRPESETIIDLLKALNLKQPFSLADVGAGSGCLGITAKLEMPAITVDMFEIDEGAIKICKKNAQHLKANVSIYKGDLLATMPRQYRVVLANLPYVPNHYHVNQAAAMEPRIAIFGGPDGLDLYRKLFQQLASLPSLKFVFTESLPFQHNNLTAIARQSGYVLGQTEDFIQVFKPSVKPLA